MIIDILEFYCLETGSLLRLKRRWTTGAWSETQAAQRQGELGQHEPEVGVYKRKQESKEKEKNTLRPRKRSRKNINQFYFQPLIIVSVICRFDQIEYI